MSVKRTRTFEIRVSFKNVDTGQEVVFKTDGERFATATKTLKFASNTKYRIEVKTTASVELYHMRIAESDLALHTSNPGSNQMAGDYSTEWNTTGIEPSAKSARHDIQISFQESNGIWITDSKFFRFIPEGPCGTIKDTLQTKFYEKGDSHVEWGTKLEQIVYYCSTDGQGNVTVNSHDFK